MGHGVGCSLFREQVVWVGRLWEGWSEVEQVVVVYSLLRRLPPVPARFLTNLLLHQAHSTADPAQSDIAAAEAAANDPAWVREVGGEGVKDGGASELLHHLPLLRPSNTEAKLQYLSIIPKVLAQALASAGRGEDCGGSLEDARQVLSYSLLHPAITGEERRALSHWLTALQARLPRPASQGYPPATTTAPSTPSTINNNNNSNIRNSCSSNNNNSATCSGSNKSRWSTDPPLVPDTGQTRPYPSPSHVPWDDVGWCSSSVGVGSIGGGGIGIGVGGGGSSGVIGSGSSGVCGGEAPQSPNNSATSSSRSSGGDSNTEEPPCHPHPGMRDVGLWLKSLRLHKYAPLLCHLSYTELVALDEVTLEAQGVTKGARHKIVLSVHKLKERHKQLHQIEKEVVSGGHLLSCLNELKSIILTPFPPPCPSSTEPPLTTPPPSTPPQDLPSTTGTSSTPSTILVTGSSTVAPPFPSTPSSSTSSSTISLSTSSSSTSFPTTIISTTSTATTTTTTSSSTPSSLSTSASSSACSLRGEEGTGEPEREGSGESGEGGEGGTTTPDSDLPSQFTRVMGKVCTQLLVSVRADEECVSGFLALVERCLCHEAFTATQARRLTSWKHQVLRVARPLPPRTKDQRHGRRWSQQLSGDGGFLGGSFRVGGSRVVGGGGGGSQRHNQLPPGLLAKGFPPPQTHPLFPLPPTVSLGGLMSPRNSLPGLPSLGVPGLLSPQQFLAKRPSLQETPSEQLRPHITLQRTRSAPSRPHQLPLTTSRIPHPSSLGPDLRIPGGGILGGLSSLDPSSHYPSQHSYMSAVPPSSASPDPADTDITDRLESLCLSVTEHALG